MPLKFHLEELPAHVYYLSYANALLITLNNRYFLQSKAQNGASTFSSSAHTYEKPKGKIASNLNSLASTLGDDPEEYPTNAGVKISKFTSTSDGESFQLSS